MIGNSECPTCKKEFKWKRNTENGAAKYCSNACRPKKKIAYVQCESCKQWFSRYEHPAKGKPRFCTNECRFKSRYWIPWEWDKLSDEQKFQKHKEYFENHVIRQEGCWNWSGAKDCDGYSKMTQGMRAHRFSWMLHKAAIPQGYLVCHHCDNPTCTNPDHLFVGLPKDNSLDMVKKARSYKGPRAAPIGSKNGFSKLDENKVLEIKKLLSLGVTGSHLSRKFGVHKTCIHKIKVGESWAHVKDE